MTPAPSPLLLAQRRRPAAVVTSSVSQEQLIEAEAYVEKALREGTERKRLHEEAYRERRHRRKAAEHGIPWQVWAKMTLRTHSELVRAHTSYREQMHRCPDEAELARQQQCLRPDKRAYLNCPTGRDAAKAHRAELKQKKGGAPDTDVYVCGQDPATGQDTGTGCGWLHVGTNPIKTRTRIFEKALRRAL